MLPSTLCSQARGTVRQRSEATAISLQHNIYTAVPLGCSLRHVICSTSVPLASAIAVLAPSTAPPILPSKWLANGLTKHAIPKYPSTYSATKRISKIMSGSWRLVMVFEALSSCAEESLCFSAPQCVIYHALPGTLPLLQNNDDLACLYRTRELKETNHDSPRAQLPCC